MDHLKEGKVVSCGCYNREKAKETLGKYNYKGKNSIDITGLKSGFLVAIEPTDKRKSYGEKSSHVIWKCLCTNPIHKDPVYCEAMTFQITGKKKISCGCVTSKGEQKIIELLEDNEISYEKEKKFKDLRTPTGEYFRFDFFVNNFYCIEYDGIQHFKESHFFEPLEYRKERDLLKNEYCKNNNIPLIRIPYTKLNDLCIEDLLLETSQFRIN